VVQALEGCTDCDLPLLAGLALRLGAEAGGAAAATAAGAVHRRSALCSAPAALLGLLDVLRCAIAQHGAAASALLACCRCASLHVCI
jgi:hypothetical protein